MLGAILYSVRQRLPTVIADVDNLRRRAADAPAARPFGEALAAGGLQVIAEVKRRSPSAGDLALDMDPAAQARAYAAGGAAAVSVLTEPDHFSGSLDDLIAVRRAVTLPVLRKDFVLHPAQIWEARAAGADAVLLIVAALDDGTLRELLAGAQEAGLDALVEVHTVEEAERALRFGPTIVGVNNRDLGTFTTDLATAERIAPLLASVPVRVAESGVSDAAGATRMANAGYQAVLVGEALVRSDDPGALIAELSKAAA